MSFSINPQVFQNVFTLPSEVADKHLKLASATQIKVILYIFRHISDGCDKFMLSNTLNIHVDEVEDALLYWCSVGILNGDTNTFVPLPQEKKFIRSNIIKPSREEIAQRGAQNKQIQMLLQESQIKFGRILKNGEASTLVWLFDDAGMDVSLILMLIEYAVSENKCNISFIEKTAIDWLNAGVKNIADAEKHIADMYAKKTAWKLVQAAFGIDDRMASAKELDYAQLWINEWHLDRKMLRLAYERCVDAKSKFSMPYTAKILESWHNNGYRTDQDVIAGEEKKSVLKSDKNGYATYDIDLIEEMMNKGYGEN